MNRFDQFVSLLTRLDAEVWNETVTSGVGWRLLLPVSRHWEFGRFAALFVMLGLNNYQNKRKAEVGYWPKVVPLIPHTQSPETPAALADLLEPFFWHERFRDTKVARLKRFTESQLCAEIWCKEAPTIAAEFPTIWMHLGRTMNQRATDKTIVFAMKCLALALLMVEEVSFDYSAVPVPVDLRIRSISARLGLGECDDETERERWQSALNQIRAERHEVTMLHLDNILWGIGTKSPAEIKSYLRERGANGVEEEIANLLGPVR